jgi:hypothetical protein
MFGIDSEMPRIIEIELTKLRPNPDQPRKRFDEETIKELADSIGQHGLIQPISVVPDPDGGDGYVIVAGERRYRAHQLFKARPHGSPERRSPLLSRRLWTRQRSPESLPNRSTSNVRHSERIEQRQVICGKMK